MTHSEKLKFLEQVYFEQVPNMLKYAEIALNNLPLAEDAVQTSFKIALEKIDDFINSPKPVGWIKNVLKNEIMHKRREQQKWQQNLLETELNQIPIYDEISIETTFSGVDKNSLTLLTKIYIEGIPYQQLADEMNISLPALKMQIRRAKDRIIRELTLK